MLGDEIARALRVIERRLDLAPVTDDVGVCEQTCDIARTHAGDPLDFEAGESRPEALALAQDGEPRQSRLEALEADLLEQAPVIRDRESPLVIVVGDVERIVAAPPAARLTGGRTWHRRIKARR